MILVHGFAGAITTYYTLKNKSFSKLKLSQSDLNILWFLGPLGGIFPDFDISILLLVDRILEHRRFLTHSIIPYTLLFILINLVLLLPKKILLKMYIDNTKMQLIKLGSLIFYFGVLSHLFLDYFVGGLTLLAPFSNNYFGYELPFSAKSPLWQYRYFTSGYAIAELSVALLFFSLFNKISNKVGRYLPIFFFFVALSATLVFMYL